MKINFSYKPTDRQQIAHDAKERYKLFGGAMGGGKSYWLCAEVMRLLLKYPGNRAVMCRYHLSDFKNTTLVTMLKLIPKELQDYKNFHNKSEHVITFPNGSQILYMGLSEEQDISKFKSMEFGVFAFDEASEIPKAQFDLAKTRFRWTCPNGKRPPYYGLLTSNPEDCWLKDVFIKEKRKDHIFIPSLPKDNPHLPRNYKENFSDMPDDWVKRYWEGNWDDLAAGDTVIPRDWIDAAIEKDIPRENKPCIGVDIGRFGDDETVAYFAMGTKIIDWMIKVKQPLTQTTFDILELEKRNLPAMRICTDDIGLGGGVTDFLSHHGAYVDGVNVGRRAEDERFFNQKAEIWWHARDLFREGRVSIPNDDKLIRQLSSVKFRYRATGKIIVEPKEDTKKRLGMSPDRADALVLTLWASKGLVSSSHDYNRNNTVMDNYGHDDGYGWNEFYEHGDRILEEASGYY
jgi:hypothetical protein